MLVYHAFNADYIEMAVQHKSRGVGWTDARDDVRTPGRVVSHLDDEAPVVEDSRKRASAASLAARIRGEGWVSRIDLDQSAGERERIASRDNHGLPSFRRLT